MTRLKLGFVGAGAINSRLMPHFLVEDTAASVEVTGVCDPVIPRAKSAAERFDNCAAYDSLDAMLADDRIDAVTIGSPIGLHFEQARAALLAGKHVHVNKTMTITTDEADELIDLARTKSLVLVPSPGEMLRPHNQRIKELIDSGEIGQLSWAVCGAAFGNYHAAEPERQGIDVTTNVDPTWYFKNPGGGPLYDLTVYSLHGLTGILGPVKRVTALSGTLIPQRTLNGATVEVDVHDNTVMLLDFGANRFAFAYGTAAGNITPEVEFDFSGRYYGTDGEIIGLALNGVPFDYDGRTTARRSPDEGVHPNFGGNELILPHTTEAHWHLQELHVFEDIMQMVDWAKDGTASVVTAEHARHVIEIIELAYRAAATGQTQTLRTYF